MIDYKLVLEINNNNNPYILKTNNRKSYQPQPVETIIIFQGSLNKIDEITKNYKNDQDLIEKNCYHIFHLLYLKNIIPNPFNNSSKDLRKELINFIISNGNIQLVGPQFNESIIYNNSKSWYFILRRLAQFFINDFYISMLEEKEKEKQNSGNYIPIFSKQDYQEIKEAKTIEERLNRVIDKSHNRFLFLYRNIDAYLARQGQLLENLSEDEYKLELTKDDDSINAYFPYKDD